MTERGRAYIVGSRAEGRIHHPIPGTRVIDCELCAAPTLFAPSSLNHPAAREPNVRFICLVCCVLLRSANPAPESAIEVSEAQLRELEAAGAPDPNKAVDDTLHALGLERVKPK